jgi:uncharacterized protein (TIGR02453 family)
VGTFSGFPAAAITFFEGLEGDNTKAYWTANKATYENAIKEPFLALCEEIDAAYRPLRLFRPYRDTRFSKDKSPYKTWAAASGEAEGGTSYYVSLSAQGLMAASGYWGMAPDQLGRFREAVDNDRTGRQVQKIVDALVAKRFEISAHGELKSVPRGYAKDHPRLDLLRRKGLAASRGWPVARWLHTKEARRRVEEVWAACGPMNAWLDDHVGPSQLPPDERDVR